MKSRRPGWWILIGLLPLLLAVGSGIWLAWFSLSLGDRSMQSMAALERSVILGQFVRALHRWGAYATLVIVTIWSYRAWRRSRLSAVMGAGLLAVILAELITGLWLPWDKMALWVLLRGHPSLSTDGSWAFLGWPPTDILWWYGLHLVLLPLVGVGVAFAARHGTRSDQDLSMDR